MDTKEFFINTEIESEERFAMNKFMDYSDTDDPLTSSLFDQLKKLKPSGIYSIQKEEGSPDLLSFNIYGSVQYWWLLLFYNNLLFPEDLKLGMSIKYPSLKNLEDIYFSLAAKSRG